MKKVIVCLLCVSLLVAGCAKKEPGESGEEEVLQDAQTVAMMETEPAVSTEQEPAAVVEAPAEEEMTMEDLYAQMADDDDPMSWTINRQKKVYDMCFQRGNLYDALVFRCFIESLAQYHHNEPVYEYNPVFLCYEKYPDIIPLIFQEKPELFTRGNIDFGSYSKAPVVYAIQNLGVEDVAFYYENNIPFLDVSEDHLYGTLNRGGPRFGIGGNLLTYASDPEIIEYLISQGIPPEVEAEGSYFYYLTQDEVEVHAEPGNDTEIVGTLTEETRFKALSVLTYDVDGHQWMKVSFDGIEGWIPRSSFQYDTGI